MIRWTFRAFFLEVGSVLLGLVLSKFREALLLEKVEKESYIYVKMSSQV